MECEKLHKYNDDFLVAKKLKATNFFSFSCFCMSHAFPRSNEIYFWFLYSFLVVLLVFLVAFSIYLLCFMNYMTLFQFPLRELRCWTWRAESWWRRSCSWPSWSSSSRTVSLPVFRCGEFSFLPHSRERTKNHGMSCHALVRYGVTANQFIQFWSGVQSDLTSDVDLDPVGSGSILLNFDFSPSFILLT